MGTLLNIEVALQSKLATLSPAVSTAWPNTSFKPVENTAWIRPTYLASRSPSATLSRAQYHEGIYQIDIFVPLEKGIAALMTIVDNIYTLYRGVNSLTAGGSIITLNSINRGPTQKEEAWYHGIVEINFKCFDAQRNKEWQQ